MAYKQNNFYRRWQQTRQAVRRGRWWAAAARMAPAAGAAVVCLALWAGLCGHTAALQADTARLEAWCADAETRDACTRSAADRAEAEALQADADLAAALRSRLAHCPVLDRTVLERLESAGQTGIRVELRSYDAVSGALELEAVSEQVMDIPGYVRRLEQTGLFSAVDYTGYESVTGGYALRLSCVLAAPEGEAAE